MNMHNTKNCSNSKCAWLGNNLPRIEFLGYENNAQVIQYSRKCNNVHQYFHRFFYMRFVIPLWDHSYSTRYYAADYFFFESPKNTLNRISGKIPFFFPE